jgi:large subunit ribosomal protein L28
LANPPHKDAKLYSVNGESGTIYYPDVQVEGTETPLNIKVGRRKLLKELYEVEKRESLALGEPLTGRNFHDKFRELSAEEIVKRLAGRGYDFGNVTVQI